MRMFEIIGDLTTQYSTPFPSITATRSPFRTPCRSSPLARASLCTSRSW